ncbi:MAG: hypothetical protein ABIG28_00130 [archaeon]
MESKELAHVAVAVLMMFVVSGLGFVLAGDSFMLMQVFVFSFVVVVVPVVVKKVMAYSLDARVEHEIWHFYRFGWWTESHFKSPVPFGLITPLFFSAFSLGIVKVMTFLTYETRALKHRAAKRFGHYSYTSMTDWHNGLIGATGVVSLLVVSVLAYFGDFGLLGKMAAYYAFWNIIPFSKLDGTQIFFGNRIVWSVLAVICLIFVGYAWVL